MNGVMDAAERGCVVVWAVALCAPGTGSLLLAMLPRDRDGAGGGMAVGIVVGGLATAARHVVATCGIG